MQISATLAGDTVTLALAGRFDFSAHRDFRSAYQEALAQPAVRIAIDFSQVDYMDSAALGMLLLLRQSAEAAGKAVVLAGATGAVLRILEIANFRKLFAMN